SSSSPGKDGETNPGIYGKALAQWLAEQLRAAGFPTGEVIAEDFAWCVPVESKPHSLYVACASAEQSDQCRVFAFAEGGVVTRLLGKDKSAESLAGLFAAVRRCLESEPASVGSARTQHDAQPPVAADPLRRASALRFPVASRLAAESAQRLARGVADELRRR